MKIKTILICTSILTLNACTSYARNEPESRLPLSYTCMQGRVYGMEGCTDVYKNEPVSLAVENAPVLPIVSSYTVLFDFDKSDIRGNEMSTLDRIAQEINTYHPKQVTVTGYTDSRGTERYNRTLSRHREEAVSNALMQRGIKNQTLDREARGEYEQAVQTADGVKNQENRRVVIDFRR